MATIPASIYDSVGWQAPNLDILDDFESELEIGYKFLVTSQKLI